MLHITPQAHHIRTFLHLILLLSLFVVGLPLSLMAAPSHGISIFNDVRYSSDFTHFDYVNPNAPKGGTATIAAIGTFDSLHPFILKGVPAQGVGMTFDTLMQPSMDEPSSVYGLIATTADIAPDRSHVVFTLNPNARFHDDSPITSEDVVFTFNALKTKGHPHYKAYYRDVSSVTALGLYKVRFDFSDTTNRELPIIVSLLPILSKNYFSNNDFESGTLTPLLGSGPYRISNVDAGRSVTYERVKNYWAKDLPSTKGYYNFDTLKTDYYRDATVAVEALKAGEYDFRKENISKTWATSYNIPHITDGRMIKEELADLKPSGMQAFVFNLRRSLFKDRRVREAFAYAYDFEWANENLFFSAYHRNRSFFGNSIFEAKGLPSEGEKALLTPYRDSLPDSLFTQEYHPPSTSETVTARDNLIKAQTLLDEAGWILKDFKRINPATGRPATVEFLLTSPAFERVVAPFVRNLKRLGIDASIRVVDSSQYIKRLETFDFDIVINWFTQGAVPGNELVNYWHSSGAERNGSQNYAGINNPAIDALVEAVLRAQDKQTLITAARALDRVLTSSHYVIPQWHSRSHRLIYWNHFGRPDPVPPYSHGFPDIWWYKK